MEKVLKIYCNNCKNSTKHEILKIEKREYHDNEVDIYANEVWQIIECLGCENISFRHISTNSEDYDPETGKKTEYITLYPSRTDASIEIKPFYNVPLIVKKIYAETIEAYNNELNILCAAGLRAIIESICKNENILNGPIEEKTKTGEIRIIRSKSLIGKINGLHEKGIITRKQVEILHQQRFLGNEALHDFEIPQKKILTIAIEIIEHILDFFYEMDDKVETLSYLRKKQLNKQRKANL